MAKEKPNSKLMIEPVPLARFQNKPSRKVDTAGGAGCRPEQLYADGAGDHQLECRLIIPDNRQGSLNGVGLTGSWYHIT